MRNFTGRFLITICLLVSFHGMLNAVEPISPVTLPAPANKSEIELGKLLFNDKRLSADNSIACVSCHEINKGGDDGLKTSLGINQQVGPINTPTVLNSGLNAFQFWDGRANTLEEQVEGPIHNVLEMGTTWSDVIRKLKRDEELVILFKEVYAQEPNKINISRAIATYEKQLVTLNAPFDLFLNGDKQAISTQAKKGYLAFKTLGCISCHQGKNVGGNMFQRFGIMGDYFKNKGRINTVDYGRYNVTGKEEDKFKFKVPSLRNIELTAPYFHDGSVSKLSDAIRVMARFQLGRPISSQQVEDIEAFLKTLTGTVKAELQ